MSATVPQLPTSASLISEDNSSLASPSHHNQQQVRGRRGVKTELAILRQELKQKEQELCVTKQSIQVLNTAVTAFCYAAGTTFAIFVCLSNSLTAMAQTIWSDVGNNWAYMWGLLQDQFSGGTLYIGGTMLLHLTLFWGYSGILAYLALYHPQWLTRFKIQPVATQHLDREKIVKTARVVFGNQIFVGVPFLVATLPIAKWRGCSFTLPLPSFNYLLFELVMFMIVEEILFYYSHRLLHHRRFYGLIHKQHHEWTAPIGMAALYCHPFEHLVSNIIPATAGPLLMGSHLASTWAWQILAIVATVNSHSGFHFPFLPSPEAHDFHHMRFNENFGVFGILDYLHGTDVDFRNSLQYKQHYTFFSLSYVPVVPNRSAKEAKLEEEKVEDYYLD